MKLLFALTLLHQVFAWDPFGIGHAGKNIADHLIAKLCDKFLPAVKKAVTEEIDYMFDNKLPILIEEVNKAMADTIDHAEDDANEFMKYTLGNISDLIENTINVAGQMMDHEVEEISHAMNDFIDKHVTGMFDHVFAGLNNLLTRFEQDVQHLVCELEGVIKQMELFIDTKDKDSADCGCVLKVKTSWAQPCECSCGDTPDMANCHCSPASWIASEDQLAYDYVECQQRKAIESGLLPVDKIVTLLGGLRQLSEQLRCYHLKDGSTQQGALLEYTGHVLNISKEIYVWSHPFEPVTV